MPLTFDLPLEQLTSYEGTNPRPADVDEYWDKAIAEMKAVEANVELVPADIEVPHADCFDMYFTGVGGARVHAKLVRPKNADKPHPAMVMFHGYSGDSGSWIDKIAFASCGFTVAALDCRGQGGLSQDNGNVLGNTHKGHIIRGLFDSPEKLLFRSIFLDTAQLASLVMDMDDVDETKVGAYGGSQGGGLTLACASLEPRIARAFPVFPFLCDYKRVWKMDQDKDAYAELKDYFRRYDPLHEKEDEIFTNLGYIDVQFLTHRIRGEVKMLTGLRDTICPPSTQFAAYNKIQSEKSYVLYPDFGHEGLPGQGEMCLKFMQGM